MEPQQCIAIFTITLLIAACTSQDAREKGPAGTIAYTIHVESSEPGARVEVNENSIGVTPIDIKVFGDKDGTFHNFGSQDYTLRVFPVRAGQSVQTKTFRTGHWFSQEDQIPSRLFFDLNQKGEHFSIEPEKRRE